MVLAGGLSPERQVSLVSGQSICRALRELGHRAVLVDMFLGLEGQEDIFSGPAGPLEDEVIRAQEPDLEAVRRQRGDRSPSSWVLAKTFASDAADTEVKRVNVS